MVETTGSYRTCHVCGGNGVINGPDIQSDDREPPFVCDHCGGDGRVLIRSDGDGEQCDRCGEMHDNCQDGLDGEKVCPLCIRKEAAREGERGQGQRPIGEQRAIDRAERCGSGWPR